MIIIFDSHSGIGRLTHKLLTQSITGTLCLYTLTIFAIPLHPFLFYLSAVDSRSSRPQFPVFTINCLHQLCFVKFLVG